MREILFFNKCELKIDFSAKMGIMNYVRVNIWLIKSLEVKV